MTTTTGIEQGAIRPPSESKSFLIRVSRNCPWNQCLFCHTYRGTKFSIRSVDEVTEEILRVAERANSLKQLSWRMGKASEIDHDILNYLVYQQQADDFTLAVAIWLFHGGNSLFLQDANSLIIPLEELEQILKNIREHLPWVTRITSYARSQTLSRMKPDALDRLKKAGLTRIHVGMETGNEHLLKKMKKGTTPEQHVKGGLLVKKAGIELSEYIILGLGGQELTHDHALDSARLLNAIDPDFIRFRTLALPRAAPLYQTWKNGDFKRLTDEKILLEEKLLLEHLDGITSRVLSDHITNLLEAVQGRLPNDKQAMIETIERHFALETRERMLFQCARRYGLCTCSEHLSDRNIVKQAEQILADYTASECDNLDEYLWQVTARYI